MKPLRAHRSYLTSKAEPGGYIQWDELDRETKRTIRADPSTIEEDMRALLECVARWEDTLGPKS